MKKIRQRNLTLVVTLFANILGLQAETVLLRSGAKITAPMVHRPAVFSPADESGLRSRTVFFHEKYSEPFVFMQNRAPMPPTFQSNGFANMKEHGVANWFLKSYTIQGSVPACLQPESSHATLLQAIWTVTAAATWSFWFTINC